MSSSPSTWTTTRPDNDVKDTPFRFCYDERTGREPVNLPTGTCHSNPVEGCHDQFPTYHFRRPFGTHVLPQPKEGDMQYQTKADGIVFDMEDDIRAAKDYAVVLSDRLSRMEKIDDDEHKALSRIALHLLNAVMRTGEVCEDLFVKVVRRGQPLTELVEEVGAS
jgi:hypothetical protein